MWPVSWVDMAPPSWDFPPVYPACGLRRRRAVTYRQIGELESGARFGWQGQLLPETRHGALRGAPGVEGAPAAAARALRAATAAGRPASGSRRARQSRT